MVLTVGNGTVKSLWIRVKGQTSNADVIMGVYYRPPIQNGDADELLFKELRNISKLTTLILTETSTWQMLTENTIQLIQVGPGGS